VPRLHCRRRPERDAALSPCWIAYPWRDIPLFTLTNDYGPTVAVYPPRQPLPLFVAAEIDLSASIEVVLLHRHEIGWNRERATVYCKDVDLRVAKAIGFLILASKLFELIARVVRKAERWG
jgi:hypothetical protein